MKTSQKLGIWLLAAATLLGTSAKGSADYPLKSVHVAWFTTGSGDHILDGGRRRGLDSIGAGGRSESFDRCVRARNGTSRHDCRQLPFA